MILPRSGSRRMRGLPIGAGYAAAALLAAATLSLLIYMYEPARFAYERAVFYMIPTAPRALAYGERHFTSLDPRMYDIAAAEYFFARAHAIDPRLPLLNHELARIAFLRGDFALALSRIDEELAANPAPTPSSYYLRGLIEGYMGRYDDAAKDYSVFLDSHPTNWAGLNDYAWVLLKAGRFAEAHDAAARGLSSFPENPWLLNTDSIALYEMGKRDEALLEARAAVSASQSLTTSEWLTAYPGNDPEIASQGIATLRKSAEDNMHMIEAGEALHGVQSGH